MTEFNLPEPPRSADRRALSGIENFVWMLTRRFPVNFIVSLRIRGPFSTDDLRRAIRNVRGGYRGLAARIDCRPEGRFLLSDDDVPDFAVEEIIAPDDDAWQREAERQLAEPFDAWTGPLSRFVVVRGPDYVDLSAVCDHGVADGLSAVNLLRDVCMSMTSPDAPPLEATIPQSLLRHIPEEVFAEKEVRRARRWAPAVYRMFKWAATAKRRILMRPEPSADDVPDRPTVEALRRRIVDKRVYVRSWSLSEEQTGRIAERCRAEQTTVHAALSTAFARAYFSCRRFGRRRRRLIETPINARPRLKPSVEQGAGLFNLLAYVRVDGHRDSDFWAVARAFRARLQATTTDAKLFSPVIVIDDLLAGGDDGKLRRAVAGMDAKSARHDVSISNLGRVNMPAQIGALHIESVRGPIVLGQGAAPVVGVATHAGIMRFCLTTSADVIDPATAQDVVDRAMSELSEAVEGTAGS